MLSNHVAMVLFSGGQDSTTCLGWALDRFERVVTVGFDYRQRHRVELECRKDVDLAPSADRSSHLRHRTDL
jgi:7-cyano-7-deazaguanine synthase